MTQSRDHGILIGTTDAIPSISSAVGSLAVLAESVITDIAGRLGVSEARHPVLATMITTTVFSEALITSLLGPQANNVASSIAAMSGQGHVRLLPGTTTESALASEQRYALTIAAGEQLGNVLVAHDEQLDALLDALDDATRDAVVAFAVSTLAADRVSDIADAHVLGVARMLATRGLSERDELRPRLGLDS